jgi:peptidoglycan hydrolase-like protein with peptidoglycan-binding domain
MTGAVLNLEPYLGDLHSNEAPVKNATMKMLIRVLLCLVAVSLSSVYADDLILNVQYKLKRLGFYDGVVDGQMGSQTAAAIRRYQIAEKLKVTGELNPQTLRRLGISAPRAPDTMKALPATPEYVALADLFKGGPFILIGPEMQITVIRQAKKNLRLLGYYRGPIDGSPSPSLVASLKAWQASAGFRQTGRFDENTLMGLSLMPY